jgi:hypothetical protein
VSAEIGGAKQIVALKKSENTLLDSQSFELFALGNKFLV